MRQYKLTVVAWKYNDIYYAMSTPEFRNTSKHERLLIYFAKNKLKNTQFPGVEHFENVICLPWSDSQIKNLLYLPRIYKSCHLYRAKCLSLSNPYLTINMFLAKILHASEIIVLEDGLMNYYPKSPNSYPLKNLTMKILGVSYEEMIDRMSATYLWRPDLGATCWGEVRKLNAGSSITPKNIDEDIISALSDKAIFVDTPIYKGVNAVISKEEYQQLINRIINTYHIDYYLPHAFSDNDVTVNIPTLDIYSRQLTLEYLAMACNFKVYSLVSTLLVSTRFINPSIHTYFIDIDKFDKTLTKFIRENSSETVKISSLQQH